MERSRVAEVKLGSWSKAATAGELPRQPTPRIPLPRPLRRLSCPHCFGDPCHPCFDPNRRRLSDYPPQDTIQGSGRECNAWRDSSESGIRSVAAFRCTEWMYSVVSSSLCAYGFFELTSRSVGKLDTLQPPPSASISWTLLDICWTRNVMIACWFVSKVVLAVNILR